MDLPTINLACYHDEMRKEQILNIIGWIGTAMVLAGYGLYTFGIIPDVMVYHYLNLIGSVGVIAISSYRHAWQPVVINSFMALFALVAIIRSLL